MITFLIALFALCVGYSLYGGFIVKIFGPDNRKTPAVAINDGVDCIPMMTWKVVLIQLLNIAVSMTYILMAEEGLKLSRAIAYPAGIAFSLVLFVVFCFKSRKR